jgi:hypothetical protein
MAEEDAFKEREKGFEAKFKLDQEKRFKAETRRNKLLGYWLADKFGLTSAEKEAYAKEVVMADLEKPGVDDVMHKVMRDIAARKASLTEHEVRKQMEKLLAVAIEQVNKES